MKLFVYGFWSGFIERTNPTDISFFINLFQKIFDAEHIELGNFEESDILLETIFESSTHLYAKKWKYSFLFSGESRLNGWYKDYTCVLYGEKNHDNIINVPLFIPMLYCSNRLDKINENKNIVNVPKKNICAILSNPCGNERNCFLNELEKQIHIDYGGSYKNNIPKVEYQYNTQEFIDFVSQYKFLVSMENSRGETYITEKILHGFNSGNIPVYWGSANVGDYFNEERFINLSDISKIHDIINKIIEIANDDNKYLEIVNKTVYKNNRLERNIDSIVNDIKNLLFEKSYKLITKTFFISSPEFELRRFERLNIDFQSIGFKNYNMGFICPTYKHTITYEIMNKHVKENIIKKFRINGMKKSEISLFLNYKAVLEHIYKNYSDGIFLIFESDVLIMKDNIHELDEFINYVYNKRANWDLIHIGSDLENNQYFTKPYCDCPLPYRDKITHLPDSYIEDITNENDKFRLIRKFHTRCCDSFLWNYSGIVKYLDYLNNNPIYDAPMDYYMTNFFENTLDFKHYWSMNTFFIQGSNFGLEESTIQKDLY
jgi:hypothetical protein